MIRVSFIIIFISLLACNALPSQNISKIIDVNEFDKKSKSVKDVVIIDLRTEKEVVKGIIPGAIQMDFYKDDFSNNLKQLDKDKTYMVYCGSGGRSGKTAKLMSDQGFKEVYDLKGGITAWKEEGKEIGELK
ncbi:MAG: rhodanese-like domain-containing protein [Cyclobacteriaceae bacterium]|jgi:phage shock protein E|nr:rhodanese-like domain-containing protein [Cyclobacteriaceae bacterium]